MLLSPHHYHIQMKEYVKHLENRGVIVLIPTLCPAFLKCCSKHTDHGCSGSDCGKLHPVMCPGSENQLKCFNKNCSYKLHTQKCERVPWWKQDNRGGQVTFPPPSPPRREQNSTFQQARIFQQEGFHPVQRRKKQDQNFQQDHHFQRIPWLVGFMLTNINRLITKQAGARLVSCPTKLSSIILCLWESLRPSLVIKTLMLKWLINFQVTISTMLTDLVAMMEVV